MLTHAFFLFPISCSLIFLQPRKQSRESARIWELKKPRDVAELEPGGVNIEFVPPWRHPVSPQVDALGFSLQFRVSFMPSAPGSGTWHSSRAQSRHGSYSLAPKRLEAFTLSEQTSGQMATTANRHGINSTNNEHDILYPVMDTLFIFIAVSDTVAVICEGATVKRLPIPATWTKCQLDFFECCSRDICSLLNHSVDGMCASIWY